MNKKVFNLIALMFREQYFSTEIIFIDSPGSSYMTDTKSEQLTFLSLDVSCSRSDSFFFSASFCFLFSLSFSFCVSFSFSLSFSVSFSLAEFFSFSSLPFLEDSFAEDPDFSFLSSLDD